MMNTDHHRCHDSSRMNISATITMTAAVNNECSTSPSTVPVLRERSTASNNGHAAPIRMNQAHQFA